ncbi:hypothetical protein CHX27_13340 [Flavobacterium aurantiibacter]|uniref:Uncharacterized protein n=2 Tax=Flavobacterium aurantiibacter TaxID=2023067 RepID=A0A255ZGZ6_9FLAO|nr:hypothetical protein CHX27_13340 [Flavobacterium aurantiibacter]
MNGKVVGFFIAALAVVCTYCSSGNLNNVDSAKAVNDTIRIANDSLEYEVVIFDSGFNSWLQRAAPRGFYSQSYLEARNQVWVQQWNIKANTQGSSNLFLTQIEYNPRINYGYEVNYLLFNYLTYFQLQNNVNLGTFQPRRFQ